MENSWWMANVFLKKKRKKWQITLLPFIATMIFVYDSQLQAPVENSFRNRIENYILFAVLFFNK